MTFDNGGFTSRVYIVPMKGGEPRLVTPNSPSFLHGWSPDGTEMAYCAFRDIDGRQEVDVYTIPVNGGVEKRLTKGGFNDGPEYSPDGKYIWYNATNSGLMQVWRMERDGGEQTQITENRRNNWFPHVSPDGKRVVYISYGPEQLEPAEHAGGAVADGCGRRKSAQNSVAVWRARFDQRELLGRRQHTVCICELRDFGRPEMTDEVNKNDF